MPVAPSAPSTPTQASNGQTRSANSTPTQFRTTERSESTNESTTVKERIRAWQKQNADAVATPCSDVENGELRSTQVEGGDRGEGTKVETAIASHTLKGKEEVAGGGSVSRYKKSKWVDPANREWVRTRSKSTPRKRVVSDEHWKRRPSLPKAKDSSQKSSQTNSGEDRKSLEKAPYTPKSEPRIAVETQQDNREARWQRLRAERDRKVYGNSAPKDEDVSICAPASSQICRKESLRENVTPSKAEDVDEDIDNKDMLALGSSEPPSRKKRNYDNVPAEKDDGRHRRRSTVAELPHDTHETVGASTHARRISTKSRTSGIVGHILDESKKMFAKPNPGFPAPRIPSIEAWLDETPDPFLEQHQDGGPPVAMPAPLKTKPRRHRSGTHNMIREDNEGEPETLKPSHEETTGGGGSKRKRRKRSQTPMEDVLSAPEHRSETDTLTPPERNLLQDSTEQSPTPLRRSAARAQRRRKSSTPLRELSPSNAYPPNADLPPSSCQIIDGFDASEMPLKSKKACPQTGANRLSTIASMDTIQTRDRTVQSDEDQVSLSRPNGLRRKLTTHEDLMSVLSLPRAGKSTKSLKSAHPNHCGQDEVTAEGLLRDLAVEEARYMRELRTLVDGVIPVLLHCVLSRSDSAIAAGLFASSGSPDDDLRVTQPIYDMGVCLGRIESLHKRMPLRDADNLLAWAKGAEKAYSDYFKAWRTGFQDVVVNLTPADDETKSKTDGDMSRDENGDVINEDGEKADVAFLLRRPLIRVKKLSKFFSMLCNVMPSSKSAAISEMFVDLAAFARRRSNEEHGRQEDKAATKIDTRRARDLRTMTVAQDVAIEKTRSVRARDPFGMTLHHSSGQRYDCQVEFLLRDNDNKTTDGDLLICELDNSEKWLLFPPVETSCLSARKGDFPGEMILMIHFAKEGSSEPYELLSLQAETEQTLSEWIQMLGSVPLPPNLQRSQSFVELHTLWSESMLQKPDMDFTTSSVLSAKEVPKAQDVDTPIGERATASTHEKLTGITPRMTPYASSNRGLSTTKSSNFASNVGLPTNELPQTPTRASQTSVQTPDSSKTIRENSEEKAGKRPNPLRRSRAISRRARRGDESPSSIASDDSPSQHYPSVHPIDPGDMDRNERASTEPLAPGAGDSKTYEATEQMSKISGTKRPPFIRSPSSTPSAKLPIIPRLRPPIQHGSPTLNDTVRDQCSDVKSGPESNASDVREGKSRQNRPDAMYAEDEPTSLIQGSTMAGSRPASPPSATPPPPPPHRSPTSSQVSVSAAPPKKSSLFGRTTERRSSSPLKHEYAPSTASDSTSDSASTFDDSSSETSEDDEAGDAHTPLPFLPLRIAYKSSSPSSVPTLTTASLTPSNSASQAPYRSVPSQNQAEKSKSIATIYSWSDRGIWNQLHPDECSIIVTPGLISAYQMSAAHSGSKPIVSHKTVSGTTSDTSSYLHEEDGSHDGPLIALELTPLVPIRRGTALDISVRSPPTGNSKFQSSNNVMFRSRSADECEALYNLINYARINNPTYIALQNARPPIQPPVNFNINGQGKRTTSTSRAGSWLFGSGGSRKGPSSFRASSAPPPGSVAAASENSLANSFSSAMRRFGSSATFSLNRSSVVRKAQGTGTPSLQSTESGTSATGGSGSGKTSPAPSQMLLNAAGGAEKTLGINNIKIRLYTRDQPGQPWTHLGPARLSVLPAPEDPTIAMKDGEMNKDSSSSLQRSGGLGGSRPASSSGAVRPDLTDVQSTPRASTQKGPRLPSSSYTPHRKHGNGREKRVLIVTKSKSKSKPPAVLLDECLGESCFNRVGRIGMAISVWKEELEMKKVGGVVTGKDKLYMVQFHGEAEAAWVFGSLGRMRF